MADAIFRGIGLPLIAVAAIVLLLATLRWRRRRPASLCPGPGRRWIRWIDPRGWCWIRGCRYDLTGLPAGDGGAVRCPECGRTIAARRAIGTRYRWRAGPCALIVFAVGCGLWIVPAVRHDGWPAMLPTMALVVTERVYEERPPRPLTAELDRRLDGGTVTGLHARALASAAVRDLRDDDISWNAYRAMKILRRLGGDAAPALEAALRSPDWQQRQLAAHVLRRLPGHVPGDDLLRVSVEALRDDDLPSGPSGWTPVYNASAATRFLANTPVRLDSQLVKGLDSDDTQQRLLSAAIAVRRGRLLDRAVPILIEHMKDNEITGDRKTAYLALVTRGREVIPMLEPHRDAPDEQLRSSVRQILQTVSRR